MPAVQAADTGRGQADEGVGIAGKMKSQSLAAGTGTAADS